MTTTNAWLAVLGTMGVTILSLIGVVTLWLSDELLKKVIPPVLALAVGALLGDACIHLIPYGYATWKNPARVWLLVFAGAFAFFLLEVALAKAKTKLQTTHILPIGPLSLIANGIHNFVDGALIGAAFLAGPMVGGPALLAVALHEIPHEAANYGILLHAGYPRGRAVWLNFSVGLAAMLGVGTTLLVGSHAAGAASVSLPVTAGCFIYMSCADLVPAVHSYTKGKNLFWPIAMFFVGLGAMFVLLLIE